MDLLRNSNLKEIQEMAITGMPLYIGLSVERGRERSREVESLIR
jgi:hypothetical protein